MVAANRADIAFAIQAARGDPATAAQYRTFLIGGRQPGQVRTDEPFDETTSARMRSGSYASEAHVDGSPQIYVMPKSIGALLYGVLGAVATVGAGDPYEHTITPADELPYVTFWRWLADLIFERSEDCKITQLVLHGESGKPLTATATVMGLKPFGEDAHEEAVLVEKSQRFMHYDGAAALQLEGEPVSCIRSFDLTINNNGQLIPGDDFTPCDVAETRLDVTLRTTQLVTDAALWGRIHYGDATPGPNTAPSREPLVLGGSPAGADFLWTRVPASPGPERSMQILLPLLVAKPFDLQANPAPEPLVMDVTYECYQPEGDDPITAIVVNGEASIEAAGS